MVKMNELAKVDKMVLSYASTSYGVEYHRITPGALLVNILDCYTVYGSSDTFKGKQTTPSVVITISDEDARAYLEYEQSIRNAVPARYAFVSACRRDNCSYYIRVKFPGPVRGNPSYTAFDEAGKRIPNVNPRQNPILPGQAMKCIIDIDTVTATLKNDVPTMTPSVTMRQYQLTCIVPYVAPVYAFDE